MSDTMIATIIGVIIGFFTELGVGSYNSYNKGFREGNTKGYHIGYETGFHAVWDYNLQKNKIEKE